MKMKLMGRLRVMLLAMSASLAVGTSQATADPDSNNSASGVTSPALLALITNDDLFATTDLTTVLDPAGPNATQH